MGRKKKALSKSFHRLFEKKQKGIAWLIDPAKFDKNLIPHIKSIRDSQLDFIFIGGSKYREKNFDEIVFEIKNAAGNIPVLIFPGSKMQVSNHAHGILFLSLLSGRNPEFLISQQIAAAESIYHSELEVLPTAYLLVNDGELKSVHRESNTLPILNRSIKEVVKTALAGKYLGMDLCFLDAGSGATSSVATEVIQEVKKYLDGPLIVGGGIDNLQKIHLGFEAGADVIVIGNQIEKDPHFLTEVLSFKDWYNQSLHVN